MIDDIYISLDDLKNVFRKKKRKITQVACIGGALCCLFLLFKAPSYEALATFQQSSSRGEQGFDIRNFMRTFSGGGTEGSTAPVMLSRAVLGKTVETLGLQAVVSQQGYWSEKISALKSNLLDRHDIPDGFTFENVLYDGEKARNLRLRFTEPDRFEILDSKQQKIGVGELGQPISFDNISLSLVKTPSSLKIGKLYSLSLLPKRSVVEDVKARTLVKPLRDEKNILSIKFSDRDPSLAAAYVNTLMAKYEEFLIDQNKTIIGSQLKYLDRRQNELNDKLDIDLNEHVAMLKKSLQEQGFMGVQQELESILEPLKTYRERLDDIEVETAGLKKRISQSTLEPTATKLVHQFGDSLSSQMNDASALLQKLHTEEPLPRSQTFAALIGDVEQAKKVWENSKDETEHRHYLEKREKLASHLQTFMHHLAFRQKSLEESSNYIDTLETDFRGMTLENSRQLFQNYCNQLDELHAQLKQVIFFRDHLHEPDFEISTLSNVLQDSVTQQLVQKSSEVESQLCDLINHSVREQERLKESLATQKRFLESHLSQTIELGKIRIQLIKEKIGSLYEVMKDLLQKEKEVLLTKIADLKINLTQIPELWHMEKRLDFKAQLTKGMMEGLTQITESKNLSRHLYQVESKPLDTALEPLQPKPSRLLLKTIGAALGLAFFYYLFLLFQAFFKGMPLSLSTLRLMGAHTAGNFSEQCDAPFEKLSHQDLETLRSLTSFLLERKKQGLLVALLGAKGSNFSFNLARLLALHHQKIAILDCNFDRIVDPKDEPGLWHYLNGDEAPFRRTEQYDFLPAGGATRHGVELLSSERFSQLLNQCRKQYDFIFLLRQTKLNSQDALQVAQITDLAIVATADESQESLKPYLQKEKICATFAQYPILVE